MQSEESLYNFFDPGYEATFYSLFEVQANQPFELSSRKNTIKTVEFSAHSQTKSYQRSVYSLLDFIGDVGGLLDGLKMIGQNLLFPFTSFNFTMKLLAQLFTIRDTRSKLGFHKSSKTSHAWKAA